MMENGKNKKMFLNFKAIITRRWKEEKWSLKRLAE